MKIRISILVVDDDAARRRSIISVLSRCSDRYDCSFVECANVQGAISAIGAKAFDLAIIDLQLPNRDFSPLEATGGLSLLTAMDGLNATPICTVCVSSHDELIADQGDQFLDMGITLIQHNAASDRWERIILACLGRVACVIQRMNAMRYNSDFVIFCATDTEYGMISQSFAPSDAAIPDGVVRSAHRIKSLSFIDSDGRTRVGILAQAMRMGPSAAAALAASILGVVKTNVALMTGICAGFSDKCKARDLVIVESSFNWDGGKIVEVQGVSKFVPDHDSHRCSTDFSALVRDVLSPDALSQIMQRWPVISERVSPSVNRGSLATGSSVVASAEAVAEIRQTERQCIGIDMESYSIYQTIYSLPDKPRHFGVIKAVSDFADAKKTDEHHSACLYIASNAAKIIVQKLLTVS